MTTDLIKTLEGLEKRADDQLNLLEPDREYYVDFFMEVKNLLPQIISALKDADRMREALEFYAKFESDEDGFGGVNGAGMYVIRNGITLPQLDKGRTAQKALTPTADTKESKDE